MRILWQNFLDSGSSWTAYSEDGNYPVSNLYDTRLSRVYRTNGLASTEYIQAGESTVCAPTYVALVNHNISSSATITLTAGTSSGMSTLTYTQTLTWSSYTLVSTITSTLTANYFRLKIAGLSTLTQSYVSIGYLYLGTYLEMPGVKPDQTVKDETMAKVTISDGGQAYGDDNYSYRAPMVNFPGLTSTQRADIRTMFAYVKNFRPIMAILWPSNQTEEKVIYGILDQKNLEWKKTGDIGLPWSLSLQIREIY
jgi:hypothetical protein